MEQLDGAPYGIDPGLAHDQKWYYATPITNKMA
jgi:hypothetical protein